MESSLIDALVGLVLPVPISFIKGLVTKPSTPKWQVYSLALGVSVLVGIGVALLKGETFDNPDKIFTTIAVVVASAQTSYKLIVDETGLDDKMVDAAKNIRD